MRKIPNWFRTAVLYELYVRAFRDADGDGHGDLPGVIEFVWLTQLEGRP